MNLSVAIPESALLDESLKIDKTRKVSLIARACAIFQVRTIYVYRDGAESDGSLLTTILRYLETPQFLRRRMFPMVNDLKFAGVLQPLRIPSHATPADPKKIRSGDVREGITVAARGKNFVDIGVNRLIPFPGRTATGKRVTIRFKEGYPGLVARKIDRDEAGQYWGYEVRRRAGLYQLMAEWKGSIIITSRKGKTATAPRIPSDDKPVLAVFGSPERGVHEILGGSMKKVQNARILDFFPGQATQTVRLEEALLGVLAILNMQEAA